MLQATPIWQTFVLLLLLLTPSIVFVFVEFKHPKKI